jgi:hypothetical protein
MANFLLILSILLLGAIAIILSIWFYFIYQIFIQKDNESFTNLK